jgi:hypothetical protein
VPMPKGIFSFSCSMQVIQFADLKTRPREEECQVGDI